MEQDHVHICAGVRPCTSSPQSPLLSLAGAQHRLIRFQSLRLLGSLLLVTSLVAISAIAAGVGQRRDGHRCRAGRRASADIHNDAALDAHAQWHASSRLCCVDR